MQSHRQLICDLFLLSSNSRWCYNVPLTVYHSETKIVIGLNDNTIYVHIFICTLLQTFLRFTKTDCINT